MLRKTIEIFSDRVFAIKFDQDTVALTQNLALFFLLVIGAVSFLLLGSSASDYFGYFAESVFLGAGILIFMMVSKKVSVTKMQVFLTFGLLTVALGTEIVSILYNGAGYVNRPYHPGLFHVFAVLAFARLRPAFALLAAIVMVSFICGAMYVLGGESPAVLNTTIYVVLAANFGLIIGNTVYIEEWQTYQAQNKIAEIKKRSEKILSNILPAEVSEELKVSRDRPHFYERDKVSVLVMDLVGYSEWVELNDEHQLASTLTNLFSRLDNVIERHHATKIKTLGDGYVVVTGLVQAENLEEDCWQTAQAFADEIAQFNQECGTSFQSRIGIGTGSAIFGVIGHNRPKFDIWGPALNMAQQMEKSCPIDDIVVCPDTMKARKVG